MRRALLVTVVLGGVLAPGRADAVGLELGLNGGYWFRKSPQFGVTFGAGEHLGKNVSVNVRAGLLINTYFSGAASELGVPVDAVLRFHIQRMYIEAVGGPWFLFGPLDFLRAHFAIGFGAYLRSFSFGIEAGWLQNEALLLARFGFHL